MEARRRKQALVIAYNKTVRCSWLILPLAASVFLQAQRPASVPPEPPALEASQVTGGSQPGTAAPAVSPVTTSETASVAQPTATDRRRASREFREALKLQGSHSRTAFEHFELAAALAPDNLEYVTAREVARQKLVYEDLQSGNEALAEGNQIRALGLFRQALALDPQNEFARQRLRDSLPPMPALERPSEQELSGVIQLQPEPGQRNFHLRGNSRDIVNQVALAYGITALFDDSFANRQVRLDLEQADWSQAFRAITQLTKSLWTPLSARQALFAANTDENRRSLLGAASATFYLPLATTPSALNDVVGALRAVFEVHFIGVNAKANAITVRADAPTVGAVEQFLRGLEDTQPEVTFDIQVYQISRTYVRLMGANVPTQFQLFNIPSELRSVLNNPNTQGLINQLIASGAINQASVSSIGALIAGLLASQQSSLLSQPFAVFGGGITSSALAVPPASLNFSRDESMVKDLQGMTLRASQGTAAVMKIGQRYPILNSTFSPIFNSSAISAVLANQSFIAPFPSFNFEDIGFNLKATPIVHRDNSVGVKLELQLRSLGTQNVNGIPIINNREFNGYISAPDGETIIAVSNLTQSEARSVNGWPVPGMNVHNNQETDDELMVILTPHVVVAYPQAGPMVMVPSITSVRPAR